MKEYINNQFYYLKKYILQFYNSNYFDSEESFPLFFIFSQ